jgi:signal transduction histidine kinase
MPEMPAILYIEDNPDNQRLVQRILGARGYKVTIAHDGTQGVDFAREMTPALILVDLGIPGLDGYETTTRLRSLAHLHEVPIIALTADGTAPSRERALVAGCDGYLIKPIDARQLPTQIAEFIGGKREEIPAPLEAEALRSHSQKLVERLEQRVRELSATNAELKEVDRLKDNFLSTLSHELRTPLTSLIGYIELLDRDTFGPLNPQQRDALSVMRRSSETLSKQLNNLLYFQELRMRKFNLQSVRLLEKLGPMLEAMRVRAIQEGIVLDLVTQDVAPIFVDGDAIELLTQNLLDNAIKFNKAGGRVRFVLRDEPRRVLLRVEDGGIGVPREVLEKIFLPFYQVDTSLAGNRPGSGLGLAIVRHIAEAHGGTVTARSNLGQGSIFTVLLPRS